MLTAQAAEVSLDAIPDHTGEARLTPVEFFAPPPAELGKILSAQSTLKPGRDARPLVVRLLIGLTIAAPILVLTEFVAGRAYQDVQDLTRVLGWAAAAVALGLAYYYTGFRPTCSYVGEHGIVRYKLSGRRDAAPKADMLLFADAVALRASSTRQYYNGVYTGTVYNFTWTGPDGKKLCVLKGSYRGQNKPPKATSPWHYANSAEMAWSNHYLDRANEQLKAEGSVAFVISSSKTVRVGAGFLQFDFGGESTRLPVDEIASLNLQGGQFSFKHKDATWYSRAGKFSFPYGNMPNAKVFLLALEKLCGYRWK